MSTGQFVSRGEREPFCCQYCGGELHRTTGEETYPYRPDRKEVEYWICRPCKAWIENSPKRDVPIGLVADARLRALREDVRIRTRILIGKKMQKGVSEKDAKRACLAWLAKQIDLEEELLIIPATTFEQCRAADEILKKYVKDIR